MKLRKVTFDDWKLLLEWRNDIITRQNSFNMDIISDDSHKSWLLKSLDNPSRELYILEDDSAVATIRADIEDTITTLSWNVSPSHRGKGYGTELLKLYLKDRKGTFIAEIKPTNKASIRMVEKNGFTIKSQDEEKLIYYKINTMTDLEIIDEIEKVRNKNNVNWMDLMRLAFKYAPDEARQIMARVGNDDNKISELLEQLVKNG